jgi:SOS response regulatory protein OraA/RecX
LTRRRLEPDAIDEAVARLKRERALDDARVAGAFARTAVRLKGRGPMRLERDLQALGIERGAARAAVREILADTDERTLARQALARRWRRASGPSRPTPRASIAPCSARASARPRPAPPSPRSAPRTTTRSTRRWAPTIPRRG